MKGHIVTLLNDKRSVAAAERCFRSAKEHGIDLEYFRATTADESKAEMERLGLGVASWDHRYSSTEAVLGNFCSQFRIWELASQSEEPTVICEHDALFKAPFPKYFHCETLVNIGEPSFGHYRGQSESGIYPLFSKRGGYLGGAHAYVVSAKGAEMLINEARISGAMPVDIFISTKRFPGIHELWPWIAVADDQFSTIQKHAGCLAKNSYRNGYQHL